MWKEVRICNLIDWGTQRHNWLTNISRLKQFFLQVAADNEAEFYINLQGAGDGELTVYGEAPYGEFPVDLLQSPTEKDTYIVRYTPRGVGEHKIHILFAGEPVAGSPFIVNVWKTLALRIWFLLKRTVTLFKGLWFNIWFFSASTRVCQVFAIEKL